MIPVITAFLIFCLKKKIVKTSSSDINGRGKEWLKWGGGGEIKYKFNFLILHIKFKENSIKTYSAEHSAKCAGEGAGIDK